MKILIISSNLIGDTILSTGVINYFHQNHPEAKFTFLIGPSAGQIYKNFLAKENIILVRKMKFNFHWIYMYSKVMKIKWDIVIDFRSSLISYFLNTKKKYIFKKSKKLNQIDQLKNFFLIKNFSMFISLNNAEKNEASLIIKNKFQYLILFPGGNWKPKIWPDYYFNTLIHLLISRFSNLKFIIVGSLEEKKMYYNNIKKNLPDDLFIDLMGKSLTTTSAYMKKSNLFIGNDSGLMHLSIASNLKTIALFGPTNDKIYGHNNIKSFIIRTKEGLDNFNKNTMDFNKSYMLSISPRQVFDLILKNNLL